MSIFVVYLVILLSGGEVLGDASCQKFSFPKDRTNFNVFLLAFMGNTTEATATWCFGKDEQENTVEQTAAEVTNSIHKKVVEMQGAQEKLKAGQVRMEKANDQLKLDVAKLIANFQTMGMAIMEIREGMRCVLDLGMTQTPFGCFKLVENRLTYADASHHCTLLGLRLASFDRVDGKEQLAYISKDLKLNYHGHYWVGLSRNVSLDGVWRWESGVDMSNDSPLWKTNEPHNTTEDDAAFLGPGSSLMDFSSTKLNYFICDLP